MHVCICTYIQCNIQLSSIPGGSVVKNLTAMQKMQDMWVRSLGWEDPLKKGIAIDSSILAWRIPWTDEAGGLQAIELQGIGHDWSDWACMQAYSTIFWVLCKHSGQCEVREVSFSTLGSFLEMFSLTSAEYDLLSFSFTFSKCRINFTFLLTQYLSFLKFSFWKALDLQGSL